MTFCIQCPKCAGEGGEWIDECEGMGPLSWHACYHCGEEGLLHFGTEEEYLAYLNEIDLLDVTFQNLEAQEAASIDLHDMIQESVMYPWIDEDVSY